MAEHALSASPTAPSEGVTGRLWKRIRGPVDLVFVDGGASGELLAARARVHIVLLVLAIHLLPGSPGGVEAAVLALGLGALAYALAVRFLAASSYSTQMGYATTLLDVSLVTAALTLLGASGDVSAPLHSIVRFQLYFLAISISSLKMNWRVSALAGAMAVVQYAALLTAATVARGWSADFTLQIGRLGTLLGAGYLGTVVVMRAQQLRDLSTRDYLTGLANRAVMSGRLTEEVARARRHGRRFSVALLVSDHFKRFNDAHGHPQGDTVLRGLGDVLRSCMRESDLVARYGGEEFVLLLPETAGPEARAKLEALRLLVAATSFGESERALHRVTLSAGIAQYPGDGASASELLEVADARLYETKRAGRNRVSPETFEARRRPRV